MLSIEQNQMMIEHYKQVIFVSKERILIQMKDNVLCIQGVDLYVATLAKEELLVIGTFKELVFEDAS